MYQNIINILSNNNQVKIKKILKNLNCSENEFNIIKYMLNQYYINCNNHFLIGELIQDYNSNFISEEKEISYEKQIEERLNYDSLNYIENIKNLIKLGWVNINTNNSNIENIEDLNVFSLLPIGISLDENLFEILENNKLKTLKKNNITKYEDYNEYLEDYFNLIEISFQKQKYIECFIQKDSPKLTHIEKEIEILEKSIDDRLSKTKIEIPLEDYIKDNNLTLEHKFIIIFILRGTLMKNKEDTQFAFNEEDTISSILNNEKKINNKLSNLIEDLKYKNETVLEYEEVFYENYLNFSSTLKKYFYFTEVFQDFILPKKEHEDQNLKKELKLNSIAKDSGIFEVVNSDKKLENVILNKETKKLVDILLNETNEEVNKRLIEWGYKKENSPITAKIIFHGKSGTGKTLTASAIANALDKKILSFDCSKILSMYVGESEKNVKKIFDTYNQISKETSTYPILILNEADQLFSHRTEGGNTNSTDKMHNQINNILLEQIESFEGIIILTTNLLSSFDKAFSRRFNYKIEFKLPSKEQRKSIWEKHLSLNAEYEPEFNVKENFKDSKIIKSFSEYRLTGGQIDLIIKNTALTVACKKDNQTFKEEQFIEEIKKELDSDLNNEQKVGFFKN